MGWWILGTVVLTVVVWGSTPWVWILGIVVLAVVVVVIENGRGSRGASKGEDLHRHGPEMRGNPPGPY